MHGIPVDPASPQTTGLLGLSRARGEARHLRRRASDRDAPCASSPHRRPDPPLAPAQAESPPRRPRGRARCHARARALPLALRAGLRRRPLGGRRPAGGFASFNDFFTRRLRDGRRAFDADPDAVLARRRPPRRRRAVDASPRFVIRARRTTPRSSSGRRRSALVRGGRYAVVYLSPRDYHRVHSPVEGVVRSVRHVPGSLYPVNAIGVEHVPLLFARNERVVVHVEVAALRPRGRGARRGLHRQEDHPGLRRPRPPEHGGAPAERRYGDAKRRALARGDEARRLPARFDRGAPPSAGAWRDDRKGALGRGASASPSPGGGVKVPMGQPPSTPRHPRPRRGDGPRPPRRRSRHQLRLPTEVTRMDAPDELHGPARRGADWPRRPPPRPPPPPVQTGRTPEHGGRGRESTSTRPTRCRCRRSPAHAAARRSERLDGGRATRRVRMVGHDNADELDAAAAVAPLRLPRASRRRFRPRLSDPPPDGLAGPPRPTRTPSGNSLPPSPPRRRRHLARRRARAHDAPDGRTRAERPINPPIPRGRRGAQRPSTPPPRVARQPAAADDARRRRPPPQPEAAAPSPITVSTAPRCCARARRGPRASAAVARRGREPAISGPNQRRPPPLPQVAAALESVLEIDRISAPPDDGGVDVSIDDAAAGAPTLHQRPGDARCLD